MNYLTGSQKRALGLPPDATRPPVREPITVRLSPEDKALFCTMAIEAGLEPGTAARQVVELVCRRFRAGSDLIDVLSYLKAKPIIRVPAEKA